MGIIKGMLREELENSIRLRRDYKKALKKYPGGSLIKKKIKGHSYYYLAYRDGRKVNFIYKGKKLSAEFVAEFEKSKRLRAKYKELIRQLDRRIKYIRKSLHGKEDV